MKAFNVPCWVFILALFFVNAAFAGPVSHFGRLVVCTKDICGEKTGNSTPVFFKGPSLFWSDGDGAPYYRPEVVDWFVDNMQIGVIRAAMAIRYYSESSEEVNKTGGVWGYYFDKPKQKSLMKAVIDAAIENDIYVIVDWHSHSAHNETALAKDFFVEIANEYKNVPNIIWEVYNEPIGANASTISTHANTIITALRNAGNNNLVLVGSRFYSQNPSEQASDFGSTAASKNVAFTFHFYAASHAQGGTIGTSASTARTNNYAVFATEWGAVNADGDGSVNTGASDTWTTWMDNNKISNCMWSASAAKKKDNDKAVQASSMFALNAVSSSLKSSDLTSGSGKYFETYMGKNKWTGLIPSTHPKGNDYTASVQDGASITLSSTQLGLTGDITKVGFAPSSAQSGEISISADKKSITYKTSDKGSESSQIKFIYEVTQGSVTIRSKVTVNITNRRPIIPEKLPIDVSRKAPTDISLTGNLSVVDPSGQGAEFSAVSVSPASAGTTSISSTKTVMTFTPAASLHNAADTEATLNYTVKSKSGPSNTGSVVLRIKNFAPTIRPAGGTYAPSYSNTAPVGIGMKIFSGADKDGDAISFDKFYLHEQYPGTWVKVSPDSVVYTPDPTKTGKITFLAVITDGSLNSPVGGLNITLTGSGTDIGNLPTPTQIPDYVEPPPPEPPVEPVFAYQASNAKNMSLAFGFGKIELYFAHSGFAKLDVYSLSGKKIGNLLNGHQNAGSKEISLKNLNLQKGIYILRLSQGSQVKTLRVVK
jgi:hypothetical protein